jgi:hypothetical protein
MENLLEQYEDQFTLDGELTPQPGVTEEKALYVKEQYEKAKRGSRVAEAHLAELFTSTDASFSMAHLANIDIIPQLPKELEKLDGLAGQRTVKDFNPVVLRSLINSAGVEGDGVDARGAAAIVPEGTPYPLVTVKSDEESFYSKLSKRGFRFDWTFESWINDIVGFFEELPNELLTVTGKTAYAEIFDALDMASQKLPAVTLLDGTTTDPNPPVSFQAILAGSIALGEREINGEKVGEVNSFIVLVPKGRKRFLEYDIAQAGRVVAVQDGNLTLMPDSALLSLFPEIEIVETARLTGTQWKMYPKPGTTPRPVLERLNLRGYENPELRVRSDQGFYPGGGQVGLFQGGFDADTASMRYRYITGAVLWDDTWVVVSDGDGLA